MAAGYVPVNAQEKFPSHGMRIVVGYPAGGVTDIAATMNPPPASGKPPTLNSGGEVAGIRA